MVLADVQQDALDAAAEEVAAHGVDVLAVVTDVSKAEQVDALAAATIERFGAVHIVCNNAGVSGAGDPWLGPIASWEWVLGVNLWGVIHGVRAFLPHIVDVGRRAHRQHRLDGRALPGFGGPYDASKHAVVALTENLYSSMQAAQMPVGRELPVPRLGQDRHRPLGAELARRTRCAPRDRPRRGEIGRNYVRRAIDEGMQPGAVADLVVDAVRDGRFWVFPHPDWLDIAMERFHSIGDQRNPSPPEEFPGMPPRSQMLAEVMAAMLPPTE